MGQAALCYQAAVAATLLAGGANVVLCGPDAAALAETAEALAETRPPAGVATGAAGALAETRPPAGVATGMAAGAAATGRLALFVGDPARAEEPALAMARELFGPEAVVVQSVSEAVQLLARPPRSDEVASGTFDSHP